MTDLPDPTDARAEPGHSDTKPRGEVEAAAGVEGRQPRLGPQTGADQDSRAIGLPAHAPGPANPPPGRPGWATGVVSFPALLGGLIAAFAATLGLASAGGWAGIAACALVVIAMISMAVAWSE